MKLIWKYELTIEDKQVLQLPYGGRILCVQTQKNIPCLWVEHFSVNKFESRTFITVGTGHPFPNDILKQYIGTYQIYGGDLVFHVYEV